MVAARTGGWTSCAYPRGDELPAKCTEQKETILVLDIDVLDWDWPVLAASLEVGGPPGLLLAEAHAGLGPMVLPLGDGTQQ